MSRISVPRLGYGTAAIGNLYNEVSDQAARQTLTAVWDVGVRFFDTAPHYGLGLAEQRLGEFLRTKPRDQFLLSTKVGRLLRPNPSYRGESDLANGFAVPAEKVRSYDPTLAGVRESLDGSLARLGLASADIVLLHDPDLHGLEDALSQGLPALVELKKLGLTTAIGVGTNSVEAAVAAVRQGDLDVVMIANRLTLLEQSALAELVPLCHERGVTLVAAAVFNSGLLATNSPDASSRYDYGQVPPRILERARQLARLCREFGVDLPAAALQFPLLDDAAQSVVVGAARAGQVTQLAASMQAVIPAELWTRLETRELINRLAAKTDGGRLR